MDAESEDPPSPPSKERRGRWPKGLGGRGEAPSSRDAIWREAAAEIGRTGGAPTPYPYDHNYADEEEEEDDDEVLAPPEPAPRPARPAPGDIARKQWGRLRGAMAKESAADKRERLAREAAEEFRKRTGQG